jgi:hypothetical protein
MTASTYIARTTKAIMLGLALAALAVSAAQASQPVAPDLVDRYLANHRSHTLAPDDRAGTRGVAAQPVAPDLLDRYLANHRSRTVAPDDRAGTRGVASQPVAPDFVDRYLANHRPRTVAPDDRAGILGVPNLGGRSPFGATEQSAGDRFDWSDAGIGAASFLFLSSLAGSALLILLRRRQQV